MSRTLVDISIDDAVKVADEIVASGGKAVALHADITDRKQVEAAVGKLRGAFGPAGACAWLVSEEAGYVTGQTIGVNGGRYI